MTPVSSPSTFVRLGAGDVVARRYRLERVLGEGGMGVVWEATDLRNGGAVAVKMLKSDGRTPHDAPRRLLREARATLSISHPHLVRVLDVVAAPDGAPLVVMERLVGETLAERLARTGRLTVAETARLVGPAIDAVRAAHAVGVVHRDLKPSNVFLARDAAGREAPKVLDFGIAKLTATAGPFADTLTASGALLGTPGYMAPEQLFGERDVGPRADVFAIGVMLYECLSGKRPTDAPSAGEALKRLLGGELPSLLSVAPDVPEDVAALVGAMLARDPAQRLPDLGQALEVLGRHSEAPSLAFTPATTAPPPRRRSKTGMLVGACALLAAIALGGGLIVRARGAARAPSPSLHGMVRIEGRELTIGRDDAARERECARLGAECRRDAIDREQPPHKARVSSFYLDVNETTNAELAEWLRTTRISLRPDGATGVPRYVYDATNTVLLADVDPSYGGLAIEGESVHARAGKEDLPAVQITWDAARLYCASRGKRLPTEAEWELAARGATERLFPWGDDEPRCDGVVFARMEGLACAGAPRGLAPVSAGDQDWTPERVHGMGGNASEWVEDAFVAPFYDDCGACEDPVQRGASDVRVFRGGGWANSIFTHASARGRWERASVSGSLGVRCAASAERR